MTVAGKPSDDLAPGTLKSMVKPSGVPLRSSLATVQV
ncbi:type II toxin-antitoxin system HicA family toxin [Cyanobium sp. ATX 6F1]